MSEHLPDVKDLFGAVPVSPPRGKHYTKPKGYAAMPGTGRSGETCGSCAHISRQQNYSGNKSWCKCKLAQGKWTSGRGSDILSRSPACERWTSETTVQP